MFSLVFSVTRRLFLLLILLLPGCTSSSAPEPLRYSLNFNAYTQVNDSAPLKLRVLLLKSDADFMAADFYSLQSHSQQVLGNALLSSEQFFLLPEQLNKRITGQRQADARFIGVMAEYKALNGKKWRLSLPLPAPAKKSLLKFWRRNSNEFNAEIIADGGGLRIKETGNYQPGREIDYD
ncbi:type VI secretion system lipoprotein TssJ [Kalamiella sp. sgz302252]|uniref:type VI secretion system lipoprotein TssJ n=1 Tax=Pantoea sp. sgz302252 TaxID=3341827 RepID=UPI0036D2716D